MGIEVSSADATLKTLSVTIQALVVNGKQMPLAVFRQLPVLSVCDEFGVLVPGVRLWGLVRYSIKDEGDRWVVADMDGVLYRGEIHAPYSVSYEQSRYKAELGLKSKWESEGSKSKYLSDVKWFSVWDNGSEHSCQFVLKFHRWLDSSSGLVYPIGDIDAVLEKRVRDSRANLDDAVRISSAVDSLRAVLLGLPQLFIAV